MKLRVLAAVTALLGGACWAARWVADLAGIGAGWADTVYLAGLVLLILTLAGVGAGLVSSSAAWLRVIVVIACPLLAWSVYSVVKGDGERVTLDGVLGAAAMLAAFVVLARSRHSRPAEHHHARRHHGSHLAR